MPRLSSWLRQFLFPPEFRIGIPDPNARPFIPLSEPQESEFDPEKMLYWPETEPLETGLSDVVLADVATNLWLTKRKLAPNDTDYTHARHYLLAVWDKFAEAGLEIHDYDGAAFETGMSLEVLAYEPSPDVTADTVLETIRPAVYHAGRCIQLGQVIVAHPEKGDLDVV